MPFQLSISQADEPRIAIPAIGLQLRVRLPQYVSGGSVAIVETTNAPGFGPPLHRHGETEIFYVTAGRYLFEVDGRQFEVRQGEMVTVPGGCAHGFVNIGDTPASQLVTIMPGMDALAFFTELGEAMRAGRPDPAALAAFGQRWGVEFLGPPLRAPQRPAARSGA
ncbi:cupin domain-containing protein [Cupriavidus sp. 30B13]|uniref:cupin domain-containing protein n=1 Tax=Cupriavidus sp. 30B13 TaxID=3384241 RepID=UPI003B90E82D